MAAISHYKRWVEFLKTHEFNRSPTMHRFVARHKLASRFEGLSAVGYSKRTLDGYSALFNVFLAYTSFEILISAIDEIDVDAEFSIDRYAHVFEDEELSASLRKHKRMQSMLFEYVHPYNHQRIQNLMLFQMGCDSQLNALASSIRNIVAHGEMTVSGSGASTKTVQEDLKKLARLIKRDTYKLFGEYISKMEAKFSNKRHVTLKYVDQYEVL